MSAKLTVALFLAVLALGTCANIFDYFDINDSVKLIEYPEKRSDRSCACKGPACVCCLNFNITFVDLGGPGCVHMKYISPADGFSVNVSYGKNLIHSAKIQGPNPEPICLEVFGKLAQVCARFNDMAPTADGLRGCLELEPRVMDSYKQLAFPIGCFRSNSGGMEMDDPPPTTETNNEEEEDEEEETTEDNTGFNAESFLLEIYQTAEQGVAFLSSLLDLPNKLNTTKPATETTTEKLVETSTPSQRGPKNIRHPNQL